MKSKRIFIAGMLILLMGQLAGCGQKLYTKEEMSEIHDLIGYVQAERLAYTNVIADSLPGRLGEMMRQDEDFMLYIQTRDIDPNKPIVALTFDDGPGGEVSMQIMDVLEQYGAKATFFQVGDNVGDWSEDIEKRIVSMGCEVANHTIDHTFLDEVSASVQLEKINDCTALVEQYSGGNCTLMRPPGGLVDDNLQANSPMPLIMWSVDTRDWESHDPASILAIVQQQTMDGDIILMHDLYDTTYEAVTRVVPYLAEQGYQMVTVSQLAYIRGVEMKPGAIYYDFQPDTVAELLAEGN